MASRKGAVDEPARLGPAPVAQKPLAVEPEAPPGMILDAEIVAQAGAGPVAPPFGRDPLGPREARHAQPLPAPDELRGRAFGHGIDHAHLFGRGGRKPYCCAFPAPEPAIWRRQQLRHRGGPWRIRLQGLFA